LKSWVDQRENVPCRQEECLESRVSDDRKRRFRAGQIAGRNRKNEGDSLLLTHHDKTAMSSRPIVNRILTLIVEQKVLFQGTGALCTFCATVHETKMFHRRRRLARKKAGSL
jgi:hypothetical protein